MIIIYKLNFLWFTLLVVTIWPSSLFVIVQLKIRESFAPLFGDDLAVSTIESSNDVTETSPKLSCRYRKQLMEKLANIARADFCLA